MRPGRLAPLLIAILTSAAAHANDPARPSIFSATLSGGFSYRSTTFNVGIAEGQAQTTGIQGTSPFLGRLRADWFFLPWLGVEGEGSFDSFQAIKPNTNRVNNRSLRATGRAGVALRFLNPIGFMLNGSVGYGLASVPVIRISNIGAEPEARGLLSHGLIGRVGIGYSGARFEAIAGFMGMFSFNQKVTGFEPQLWLAGRVADLGATALWVGLDSGLLLEVSPPAVGYSGPTFRFALAIKLELLPPVPPPKPIADVQPTGAQTTLRVEVLLPSGAPAAGALVTVDSAAAAQVDAMGQVGVKVEPGPHAVSARLSGYRAASGNTNATAGQRTLISLRLEALTGPGQLSGIVRASATGQPIADATVTVGEAPPVQTGADGTYRFASVGPGPVKVRVEAQGFTAADEVAQVPPESGATLDVQLEPLGKGSPATVRGLVRSRTGEAITASVTIKGVATKVQVTPEGRFFVTVPGGTYLFVISAPGHVTQTKKVVLADGDQAILHADLQKVSK